MTMGEMVADFHYLMVTKFLMDAKLAIPIPTKVSHQLGAAIGVGTEVRSSDSIEGGWVIFKGRKGAYSSIDCFFGSI